jgi:hypothetical protein
VKGETGRLNCALARPREPTVLLQIGSELEAMESAEARTVRLGSLELLVLGYSSCELCIPSLECLIPRRNLGLLCCKLRCERLG